MPARSSGHGRQPSPSRSGRCVEARVCAVSKASSGRWIRPPKGCTAAPGRRSRSRPSRSACSRRCPGAWPDRAAGPRSSLGQHPGRPLVERRPEQVVRGSVDDGDRSVPQLLGCGETGEAAADHHYAPGDAGVVHLLNRRGRATHRPRAAAGRWNCKSCPVPDAERLGHRDLDALHVAPVEQRLGHRFGEAGKRHDLRRVGHRLRRR